MDGLLSVLGVLFALLLILAAAVEAVLETFRGVLERIGITWLKGKTSLEDSLKLAAEMSPDNQLMATKLVAVETAVAQVKKVATKRQTDFEELRSSITAATDKSTIDKVSAKLNVIAAEAKEALDIDERKRVFILKVLSATIGIVFAWQTDFHVFQILAASPEAAPLRDSLIGLQNDWLNRVVGGIAAAAGSNYWHDQLDKVRAVKSSVTATRKLVTSEV